VAKDPVTPPAHPRPGNNRGSIRPCPPRRPCAATIRGRCVRALQQADLMHFALPAETVGGPSGTAQ
jgi:hypothetical protein